MVFIDLRDEFGITQIVINDEKLQEQTKQLTSETCIHILRRSCGKSKQKQQDSNRRNRSSSERNRDTWKM